MHRRGSWENNQPVDLLNTAQLIPYTKRNTRLEITWPCDRGIWESLPACGHKSVTEWKKTWYFLLAQFTSRWTRFYVCHCVIRALYKRLVDAITHFISRVLTTCVNVAGTRRRRGRRLAEGSPWVPGAADWASAAALRQECTLSCSLTRTCNPQQTPLLQGNYKNKNKRKSPTSWKKTNNAERSCAFWVSTTTSRGDAQAGAHSL